jgi:uncharacterized membrane protein HdeD (DUF308 family)
MNPVAAAPGAFPQKEARMTDPRTDPADTPGEESRFSQAAGGQGGPEPGTAASTPDRAADDMGRRPADSGMTGAGQQAGASAVGTTTRQTAATTAVPAQPGPPTAGPERPEAEREALGERREEPVEGTLAGAARRSWPAVLGGGLAMVALGIMVLVWPGATLTLLAILVGAALVVSGLVRLFQGFAGPALSGGARAGHIVIGVLGVLAGLYCLRHHGLSLFVVAFIVGAYFVVHGVADLSQSASRGTHARALRAVLGVFSIIAGILMIVWPAITLVLLVTLIGAWLCFYGIVLGAMAFSLLKTARAEDRHRTTMRPAAAGHA